MATFQTRVEGLTGLTLSGTSSPTLNELTEFLKDGVIDVMHRWSILKPQDKPNYQRESAEITSQSGINVNGADIMSVVRESGTDNDWRECRRISLGKQSRVTDSSSFEYASKFNPAYVVDNDGKISVFPVPGGDPNAYKVYYVNNVPVDKGGASLTYAHSDIGYFMDNQVYLVVIYARMKALQSTMADMHSNSSINTAFTNFRNNMNEGIALFGVAEEEGSDFSSNLFNGMNYDKMRGRFKEVRDAIVKADKFVDGGYPATGYDAATYFLREDPEMVQSAMALATQQLQFAQAKLQEYVSNSDIYTKELNSYITNGSAYVQSAANYLSELQQYIGIDTQRYQWYDARYKELKSEYDNAFAIAQPQPQGGR